MIIPSEQMRDYLAHLVGSKRLTGSPFPYFKKALELNEGSSEFLGQYGSGELRGFVGFIDLAGFSSEARGKSPQEIVDYLTPFMEQALAILCAKNCLIDKTIGDEIMFVLPDEYSGILQLGQLLGGLHDLAYELDQRYRYRIGLSYGRMVIAHFETEAYSEMTMIGEPIHVAKRLHDLPELNNPTPVIAAYGLSLEGISEPYARRLMAEHLGIAAGFASRFGHKILEGTVDLKGVGDAVWALLESKGETTD